MFKGKKIIAVSPVGRKETMGHLFKQILKQRHVVDEHHMWVNTLVEEDLQFINDYAEKYPDFVHLKYGCEELDKEQMGRADNVKRFYNYCTEPDSFYFKIDDDIIYIEPGTFEKLAQHKLDNPDTFLTFPTIINNQWCTHFLRKSAKINIPTCKILDHDWYVEFEKVRQEIVSSDRTMSEDLSEPRAKHFGNLESVALSPLYWGNPEIAYHLLAGFKEIVTQGTIIQLDIENVEMKSYENMSINFIMWAGEDFKKFDGRLRSIGDEMWLNCFYPAHAGLFNTMVGNTRAVHYAYYTQREFLNGTNILQLYDDI